MTGYQAYGGIWWWSGEGETTWTFVQISINAEYWTSWHTYPFNHRWTWGCGGGKKVQFLAKRYSIHWVSGLLAYLPVSHTGFGFGGVAGLKVQFLTWSHATHFHRWANTRRYSALTWASVKNIFFQHVHRRVIIYISTRFMFVDNTETWYVNVAHLIIARPIGQGLRVVCTKISFLPPHRIWQRHRPALLQCNLAILTVIPNPPLSHHIWQRHGRAFLQCNLAILAWLWFPTPSPPDLTDTGQH